MSKKPNREGFWRSSQNSEDRELPMPAEGKVWRGQAEFLDALEKLEAKANVAHYRGWSTCRLCKCVNGSTEFSARGWVWPEGYRHYVEVHNVRPSLAFQEMVIGRSLIG